MRFYKKRHLENVETRTVTKFLWFPKIINDEIRWLETAVWKEERRVFEMGDGFGAAGYLQISWHPTRWINENE